MRKLLRVVYEATGKKHEKYGFKMGIHVPTITKVITMRNVGNDYFFSFPLLLHNWFRVGFV